MDTKEQILDMMRSARTPMGVPPVDSAADREGIKKRIFTLIQQFFALRVDEAFVPGTSRVAVGWPCYGHEEIVSAVDSLLDLQLSQGKRVLQFEREYAAYVGTKHGVAVNSGSSANLIAIDALLKSGKVRPGSEVIVPAATFTTVVSPILQLGLTPVFVDIDPLTYNIDPVAIERAIGPQTGLIMPVHSLGCPADMVEIMRIAKRFSLPVLEDCCEAHSALVNGKMVGSFGTISTYSFFVAHNMTTGEGGMVMTDDDQLDSILRSTREFGRKKNYDPTQPRFYYNDSHMNEYDERYVFEVMGYNVRMTDICASLGIEQLKRLDSLNRKRLGNVAFYNERLKRHARWLQVPTVPPGMLHTFYGYPVGVKAGAPFSRVELVRFLESKNIETRAFMGGNLAVQPAYRHERQRQADDLRHTKFLMDNVFFIGCHPQISAAAREYVMDAIDEFFARYG